MVHRYAELLKQLDVALDLRREQRERIEEVEKAGPEDPAWRVVANWLAIGDRGYFQEVLSSAPLKQLVEEWKDDESIRCEAWAYGYLGRTEGMKLTRDDWRLPPPGQGETTVRVHLESRCRGRLEVLVAPYPYERGVDDVRAEELKSVFDLKSNLSAQIQGRLRELGRRELDLGFTTRYLRGPRVRSTLCVAKFQFDHEAPTAEECAEFFERVIRKVAPVISDAVAGD
jgi:hypothetical protein